MIFIFSLLRSRENQYGIKCLLASLKTLFNSKSCSESRIKFLFRLSFAFIGQFFLVYIHSRLSEQFSDSGGWEQLLKTQAAIRKAERAL
jgi:hypothetical protein